MEHFAMHKPSKIHPSLLPKISDKLRCGNMDSATYYYHSDHLGSASWITNGSGTPIQHLQYMPYGEPFVNERTTGYEERFTFTGKERDSETGFSYFGARYYDSDLMTGWLSVDPLADKYPNLSPYAYCAWNPVKLVDPDGEEVFIIFNKETNKLYLMDLDYYKKGLPTKHVSAKDYQLNGIRDKNGELTHNQVLVINNVFSGGKIENGNIVRDPDDNRQNPLPNATYDIVDNNADTKHEGWFRLDIQDDNRYNDKDDNTDRNGFRFHLGKLSWGCVTIDATQDEAQNIWNVVSSILNSTTSTKVSERRGRQWLNPFSNLTRYGSMKVIGNDLIPYKK